MGELIRIFFTPYISILRVSINLYHNIHDGHHLHGIAVTHIS